MRLHKSKNAYLKEEKKKLLPFNNFNIIHLVSFNLKKYVVVSFMIS